jgi:hypothetical protein
MANNGKGTTAMVNGTVERIWAAIDERQDE